MSMRAIKGLSADAIQDINDVKTWARNHESNVDEQLVQLSDAIIQLEEVDDAQQKAIARTLRLVIVSTIMFGCTFAVLVILFGIPQIIGRLLDGAP